MASILKIMVRSTLIDSRSFILCPAGRHHRQAAVGTVIASLQSRFENSHNASHMPRFVGLSPPDLSNWLLFGSNACKEVISADFNVWNRIRTRQ
jgi:hypothetical protein